MFQAPHILLGPSSAASDGRGIAYVYAIQEHLPLPPQHTPNQDSTNREGLWGWCRNCLM